MRVLDVLLRALGLADAPGDVVLNVLRKGVAAMPEAAPVIDPLIAKLTQALTVENRDTVAGQLQAEVDHILRLELDPRDHPSDA